MIERDVEHVEITQPPRVIDAGEIDCELNRLGVEVNRVEVKLLEICGGRARNVGAAFAESFEAAIERTRKRNVPS